MLLQRIVMATAVLSAAMLAGCQNTSPVAGAPDEAQVYPKVTLSQASLQAALGFNTPTVTRSANDLMVVSYPVRARAEEALFIEYKFVWFDVNHRPIRPYMTWKAKRLEPRQPDYLEGSATSADAVDYNIQVRWGKP